MIQTPWEKAGSPEYNYSSTGAAEAAFLAELEATGRVGVTRVGTSVEGQPIRLVTVGATTPPPYAASPSSALLVGSIHGNETSPREALLWLLRDLAETTDPTLLAYLTAHPVYVIPTANPDRIGVSPYSATGLNLNRHHMALDAPEVRAIAEVIATVDPQIVHDMHTGGVLDVDFIEPRVVGVDPDIKRISIEAADAMRAHMAANGATSGPLSTNDTDPRTLRNAAGLRHKVAFLSEDYGGNILSRRIEVNNIAIRGLMDWHKTNSTRLAYVQRLAAWRATQAPRTSPTIIGTAEVEFTSTAQPGAVLMSPPPAAYWLTSEQYAQAAWHLDVFGLTATPDGTGYRVDLAQPARNIIPVLLDKDSSEAVTPGATRVGHTFTGAPDDLGAVQIDGKLCPIVSAEVVTTA